VRLTQVQADHGPKLDARRAARDAAAVAVAAARGAAGTGSPVGGPSILRAAAAKVLSKVTVSLGPGESLSLSCGRPAGGFHVARAQQQQQQQLQGRLEPRKTLLLMWLRSRLLLLLLSPHHLLLLLLRLLLLLLPLLRLLRLDPQISQSPHPFHRLIREPVDGVVVAAAVAGVAAAAVVVAVAVAVACGHRAVTVAASTLTCPIRLNWSTTTCLQHHLLPPPLRLPRPAADALAAPVHGVPRLP
jgi:hypothetical protein